MRTWFLLSIGLAASLSAADASKILLKGSSVSVEEAKASGAATAIVGDMTIAADVITFQKQTNLLKCEGSVTIRVSGNTVATNDCTIELSPGEKKLFFLSQGKVQLLPDDTTRYFPASSTDLIGRSSDREKVIQEFNSRQSGKTPNKTPGQKPGSVPRAIERALK